jgi:hypothetical protein
MHTSLNFSSNYVKISRIYRTTINLHTVIYPTADLIEYLNWNIKTARVYFGEYNFEM